jgi:hypothetical protein
MNRVEQIIITERYHNSNHWVAEMTFRDSDKNLWYVRCNDLSPELVAAKAYSILSYPESWECWGWIVEE